MPWVRGHYRRSRRSTGASATGGLLLAILVGVGLLASALGAAVTAVAAWFSSHSGELWRALVAILTVLVVLAIIFGLASLWLFLAGRARRQRARHFVDLARSVASNDALADSEDIDTSEVEEARRRVGSLPNWVRDEIAEIYRRVVEQIVADRKVTTREHRRLQALRRLLAVPEPEAVTIHTEVFLEVYADLIRDQRLTRDETIVLDHLQAELAVPEEPIRVQLALADQLRRAYEVETTDRLPSIDASVPLRKGERVYHHTSFDELRRRVLQSYVRDGVRHKTEGMEDVGSGTLYVTNQRLLLTSAGGATTAKLERVMDVSVDPAASLVAVVVDGRRTPYHLRVPEPYVTAAFIGRSQRFAT